MMGAGSRTLLAGGVDVGSLTTKAVVMSSDRDLLGTVLLSTGVNPAQSALRAFQSACADAGCEVEDVGNVVGTGYGRDRVEIASHRVTEISCHARGAAYLYPGLATVIDIGGQDSKVIRVDPSGRVLDFAMNDKCAAGTGRFFENMARALEMELDRFAEIGAEPGESVDISSTCTVFAESEVVGLIARGLDLGDIVRGLHRASAARVAGLAGRVGVRPEIVMTGGVARNPAQVAALTQALGHQIHVPKHPQLAGAIGAALIGLDKHHPPERDP